LAGPLRPNYIALSRPPRVWHQTPSICSTATSAIPRPIIGDLLAFGQPLEAVPEWVSNLDLFTWRVAKAMVSRPLERARFWLQLDAIGADSFPDDTRVKTLGLGRPPIRARTEALRFDLRRRLLPDSTPDAGREVFRSAPSHGRQCLALYWPGGHRTKHRHSRETPRRGSERANGFQSSAGRRNARDASPSRLADRCL
jgi:hypothetical protein